MKKSTSRRSMSERNKKLRELIKKNPSLLNEIADARVCNDIAVDLFNLRAYSGLTQKELAEKLGVKQSNISRWEHSGYEGYKVKMLSKIARALGGRLSISITSPIGTYVTYWQYREAEITHSEMVHQDGWHIYSDVLKVKELRGVQTEGIGAENATANA